VVSTRERAFKRSMLRSAFQSLFWGVILQRKKRSGLTLTDLADEIGVDKSYVSRSFSSPPNWQIDKIADFADALGVELNLVARDLKTGELFTPTGKVQFATTSAADGNSFVSVVGSANQQSARTDVNRVSVTAA